MILHMFHIPIFCHSLPLSRKMAKLWHRVEILPTFTEFEDYSWFTPTHHQKSFDTGKGLVMQHSSYMDPKSSYSIHSYMLTMKIKQFQAPFLISCNFNGYFSPGMFNWFFYLTGRGRCVNLGALAVGENCVGTVIL